MAFGPQVRRTFCRRRRAGHRRPRAVRGPAGRYPVAGERRGPRHGAAPRVPAQARGPHLPGPSHGTRPGVRKGRGQDRPRRLVAGRPGRQGPARTRPDQPRDWTMARSRSMNGKLTDEAYARAALTYLAEPTDRWHGQLLRVHGPAVTHAAITTGRLFGTRGPDGMGGPLHPG